MTVTPASHLQGKNGQYTGHTLDSVAASSQREEPKAGAVGEVLPKMIHCILKERKDISQSKNSEEEIPRKRNRPYKAFRGRSRTDRGFYGQQQGQTR